MLLRRPRTRHLLMGLLAAVGLLVMHGLSAHGLVHIHTAAAASVGAPSADESHHTTPAEPSPATGSHHGAPTEPTPNKLHVHLVALCVAVLLTVMAAIAIRSTPRLLRLAAASAGSGVRRLVAPVSTTGRLLQLCVARC